MCPKDSNGVPPSAWRQETVCPPEMPLAYPGVGGRMDYPHEPHIQGHQNMARLTGHQLDMLHWWLKLTAIPDVENPKRLSWKIHASFSILVVRCETSPGQGYMVPPGPKCFTRNLFLLDDLSYQVIWQQPLLLTMAYTQALQYWVEKFRPPAHPDFCPLVMSIMELMESVKEHVIFSKWDIIWG